ncbi:MAG: class II fructose-bisphosphate aldolase [Tissierellia bacterium]|nr:class II fructose-bisphosphate aldolase [Tissierellia bacterium]
MYLNLKELFNKYKGKQGIGSFNVHCMEMLPYIINAARRANSPVIVQTSQGTAEYLGVKWLVESVKTLGDDLDICLHLDHCKDIEFIKKAIRAGYSSVMYDGSSLAFEENIANTKSVVEFAKEFNVSVEGEIGSIGGSEDGIEEVVNSIHYTDSNDAVNFVKQTGVDALAVAIGTVHGLYKGKADINFELLDEISERIGDVGLVLHGGTGVSEEDFHKCAEKGMLKFNVGTELNKTYIENINKDFKDAAPATSLRKLLNNANKSVENIVYNRIENLKLK